MLGSRESVDAALRRLGARSSTYPGPYRIGTARADVIRQPPVVSFRLTTAGDLTRAMSTLHAAAVGNGPAVRRSGLTVAQARLALGLLLSSQRTGDNTGLLRPSLPKLPIAQKHGSISSARHTTAVVYGPHGPVALTVLRLGLASRSPRRRSSAPPSARARLDLSRSPRQARRVEPSRAVDAEVYASHFQVSSSIRRPTGIRPIGTVSIGAARRRRHGAGRDRHRRVRGRAGAVEVWPDEPPLDDGWDHVVEASLEVRSGPGRARLRRRPRRRRADPGRAGHLPRSLLRGRARRGRRRRWTPATPTGSSSGRLPPRRRR